MILLLYSASSNRETFLRMSTHSPHHPPIFSNDTVYRTAAPERLKRDRAVAQALAAGKVVAESAAAERASLREQLSSSVRNAGRQEDLAWNARAELRNAERRAAQATMMRERQEAVHAALAAQDAEKAVVAARGLRRVEQNSFLEERNALRYVVARLLWYLVPAPLPRIIEAGAMRCCCCCCCLFLGRCACF